MWQEFQFSEMSSVWIRTADLRHSLSTLFSTSFYSNSYENNDNYTENDNGDNKAFKLDINNHRNNENKNKIIKDRNQEINADLGPIDSISSRWITTTLSKSTLSMNPSLAERQAQATRWGNFSLQEVLKIAKANLDSNFPTSSSTSNSNLKSTSHSTYDNYNKLTSGTSYDNNDNNNNYSNDNNISIREWGILINSSFLEEKLALSFSVGSVQEVDECLTQWTRCCCEVRTCQPSYVRVCVFVHSYVRTCSHSCVRMYDH